MNTEERKRWRSIIEKARLGHIVEGDLLSALEEALDALDRVEAHCLAEIDAFHALEARHPTGLLTLMRCDSGVLSMNSILHRLEGKGGAS